MIDQDELITKLSEFKWSLRYQEPANVFSILMATHSRTKSIRETLGETLTAAFCAIENKMFKFYTNPVEDENISKNILEKILSDDDFFPQVEKKVDERSAILLEFSRSLRTMNYNKKTDHELLDLYNTFIDKFISMRNYSSIPTIIEMTNTFTKHLKAILSKYSINDEAVEEVFSALTSPEQLSYVSRHDLEISQLALDFLDCGKKWADIEEKLAVHQKKWAWLDYTFDGTPISLSGFKERIGEKVTDRAKLEQLISDYKRTGMEIEKRKSEVIEKYHISPSDQKYFSYGAGMVWIKFFRKGTFAESYYCVESLLSEMGRRKNLKLETIKNMFDWEMRDLIAGKELDEMTIAERTKHGYVLDYLGDIFEVKPGHLLGQIQDNIIEDELSDENQVVGQVAFAGTAEGVVKIINDTPDMSKMNEGDVLVSRSTNPKLFPAMKKAAAFVTDVGGLTCHAAIVARELGVPCVVGTKVATKVFKDGDTVLVDAVHGIVKIIERR